MERHFEHDLEELKERLLWMAGLAERAVHQAVQAVFQKDEALATRVLDEEKAINEMQIEIDDRVMQLVALQQPMVAPVRSRMWRAWVWVTIAVLWPCFTSFSLTMWKPMMLWIGVEKSPAFIWGTTLANTVGNSAP